MRHFVEELGVLQRRLLEMAGLVEHAIRLSVRSVEERDPAPANQVLQKESCINRMEIEIDELANSLLALRQPMACDLGRPASSEGRFRRPPGPRPTPLIDGSRARGPGADEGVRPTRPSAAPAAGVP